MTMLLNPTLLTMAVDLALGRFGDFNAEQKLFYTLSVAGSASWWIFLAWIVRSPRPWVNRVATGAIALLYAVNVVLVYGYRFIVGAMPNYYTFEYLFAEPLNNWTILRDSWGWGHTLSVTIVTAVFWLGFNGWRRYLSRSCQTRRGPIIAGVGLTLAVVIQFVLHNNIRFVDQCFSADMTTSTSVMRNIYTRWSDPESGRSGLSARMPIPLPPMAQPDYIPAHNTLIILTESLRADALGTYGYSRPTTPFLDSLCAEYLGQVVRFDNAFASATMTFIAAPTIVTGLSPLASARDLHTQPVFWEFFKAIGRETFLFTSQSHEWENIRTFFTIPAIDHLYNKEIAGIGAKNDLGMDDYYVVDHFIAWLSDRQSQIEFAGILQLNQTHYPYWTPEDQRPFGELERRDLYDNAVYYTDAQLRRVFQALAAHGSLDNTVIVITSDHGEAFNEHGIFGHLNCLYREAIQVPLICLVPHSLASDVSMSEKLTALRRNSSGNTSALDIVPTVLDFASIWDHTDLDGIRASVAGESLLHPLADGRVIVTSNLTEMTRRHLGLSLVTGQWHYILNLQGERTGTAELYDWATDPGESRNIISSLSPELRVRIDQYLSSYPVSRRVVKSLTSR